MRHLAPDEIVDLIEGAVVTPARRAHLDECAACRREVEALANLLHGVAEVTVPEPSPLFWERFSARVRAAVADEPAPLSPWRGWLRRPALVPLAGLALALVALVATVRMGPGPATPHEEIAGGDVNGIDVEMDRGAWDVVADLVGPLDWDTADAAGLSLSPGDAEVAVLSLTVDEQRELTALLMGELARTKS